MPASAPQRRGPRVERKIVLDEDSARLAMTWAAERLSPDPHSKDGRGYFVESIYYDTLDLSCAKLEGVQKLPKYRARRYDGGAVIYFEEKLRRDDLVWKRRLICDEETLVSISSGNGKLDGEALWFRNRMRLLDLAPSLIVSYQRWALVGEDGIRVTADFSLQAHRCGDRPFVPAGEALSVLDGSVLELKFEAKSRP